MGSEVTLEALLESGRVETAILVQPSDWDRLTCSSDTWALVLSAWSRHPKASRRGGEGMTDSGCPTCAAPAPHLHPAVQYEGEIQPCGDPFHRQVTPQNTPDRIAEAQAFVVQDSTDA